MHTLTPKIEVVLTTSRSLWYHTLRLSRLGIQVGWRNQRKGRRVFGEWGATTRSSSQRYIPNRVQVGCLVVLCAITPTGYCIIPPLSDESQSCFVFLPPKALFQRGFCELGCATVFLTIPFTSWLVRLLRERVPKRLCTYLNWLLYLWCCLERSSACSKRALSKFSKFSFVSGIPASGQSLPSNSHPAAHDCLCGLKTDIKQRHSL